MVVLFAADYPGMASHDFGQSDLDPGALEAATEVTAQGLIEARELNRRVAVAGLTLVTGATQSLVEASSQASLVVVGSRRRGPVIGAVLGSVSRSVAGRASCPVVVVPPGTAAKQAGTGLAGVGGNRRILDVDARRPPRRGDRRQAGGTIARDLVRGKRVADHAQW